MKTKTIIVSLLLFLSYSVFAQKRTNKKYVISGYITEKSTKETLKGVSVYIKSLSIGGITNNYGFFSIQLPEGIYELSFNYLGYKTITKEVSLSEDMVINESLEESPESLEEVEVIAQNVIKESKSNLMSSVSITQRDIEKTPVLLGEKDAFKTLQLLPGIQGGNEGSSGLFVRGGTPDQNLILLDEATVYNSNHLFGFFSVFNGDAIKSLTAFKGGFPARFGGRLSSVIKIDTKDGNKEKLSGKVNIGLISSSLVLEGPIKKGKTSFIFSGRRTYADLLAKPFQKKEDSEFNYFFHDVNFKIHHIFNDKNKLFWSSYLGQDKFDINFNDSEDEQIVGVDRSKFSWGSLTSTLRWNHEFNNKLFANTSLIYSNYNLDLKVNFRDFTSLEEEKFQNNSGINDYSIKTDFDYFLNTSHHIRFGAIATKHEFTPQRVKGKISSEGININVKQQINSIEAATYVEDEWKLSDKVSAIPGVRLSYFKQNKKTYLNFESRFSTVFRPQTDLAVKLSFSKMNQYVHLLPSTGISLPTDLWVTSTDKIKPQISEQIAVGMVKDFGNSGYSLNIEGYYKKLRQVIAFKEGVSFLGEDIAEGKDINFEDNITFGEGEAYGSEFLFRKQKGKFTGWLGYTLAWSTRQFDELNNGKTFFARYDRRHDISIVGNYKLNKKVTFSANWVLTSGPRFTLPEFRTLRVQNNFPIKSVLLGTVKDENNISRERNNIRGETSHRLDLGVQFHKKLRRNKERIWSFSVYNTYGRKNPYSYYVQARINGSNVLTNTELVRVSAFAVVPSISYTLKF